MPWVAPVVGGLASIGTGLIASGAQGAAAEQAKRAYEQSVKDLEAIGVPTAEAQQMTMEDYKSQGQWTPELEEAVQMGPSSMEGVSTDPAYKEAQIRALNSLKDISDSGGMTLTDKANLEKNLSAARQQERGAREAIMQNAQERGVASSGNTLAAQLIASQGAADRAHAAGLDTAAAAQQRALEAIKAGGQLGTSLRDQEFNEKAKVANAKDAIAQWNAANKQSTIGANTGVRNQASQYNLGNNQNIANANVDTRNKNQMYNKGLAQQEFENKMQVATAKANARAGQATQAQSAANARAQAIGGVGSAIAQGATAYGQMENDNLNRQADRDLQAKRYAAYGGMA